METNEEVQNSAFSTENNHTLTRKEINRIKASHLQPWQWKKGQSGNMAGRPKGSSLKDYVQKYLSKMTDEEKDEWLEGLPKEIVWKMAEGNWRNDHDVKSDGKPLVISFNSIFNAKSTSEAEGDNP